MLEEAVGIPSTDRRERLAHRLYQSLPCPGPDTAQKLLDLGERLPTLYLVVGRKLRLMRARQTAPYQGPGFAKTDIKLGSSRPFS